MKQKNEGNEIKSGLEMKLTLFNRYLSLTESMKETFDKNEPRDLLRFLSKRQDCIARIQKTDLSIDKITNRGEDKTRGTFDKRIGVIDDCLEDIKNVMKKVDIIDKELMALVSEEGENIKMALLKTQNAIKAATGYKTPGKSSPRFLDTVR